MRVVLRGVLGWERGFVGCALGAWLVAFLCTDGLRLAPAFAATEDGRLTEARGRFGVGAGMVRGIVGRGLMEQVLAFAMCKYIIYTSPHD